ncbi:MAG: TetR/AcrR family transcriptional regulator [Haloquadratum sp.]
MQDIADETELSKAALHYHFDGKHDLLVSFLDHLYERFETRIDDPDGETPAERLTALVQCLVTKQTDAPAFQTALLEIKAQSPYDEAFRERLQRFDATFAARVRDHVARGVADGTFRADLDPDEVASVLTTFVTGAQTRHVAVGHSPEASAAAIETYIDEALRPGDDPASDGRSE